MPIWSPNMGTAWTFCGSSQIPYAERWSKMFFFSKI